MDIAWEAPRSDETQFRFDTNLDLRTLMRQAAESLAATLDADPNARAAMKRGPHVRVCFNPVAGEKFHQFELRITDDADRGIQSFYASGDDLRTWGFGRLVDQAEREPNRFVGGTCRLPI